MLLDIRRFDIYRKVPKDLTQPTLTGAFISVCCCLFIVFLFLAEFASFINPEMQSELFVNGNTNVDEKIPVRLNISLPYLKCEYVGLDIQDDLGRHEVGFVEDILKVELGEGCRFEAKFSINKVPGNFHVSTHSLHGAQPDAVDMRHIIHELTFGEPVEQSWNIPGSYNTLESRTRLESSESESHEYILKLVPTIFKTWRNFESYQYTYAYKSFVSMNFAGKSIPALWFRYDLTPITVQYHTRPKPIYSFFTMLCAIIGGTFTVAGILDSFVFSATEMLRKNELGKLS
ncbi:hypothetical protein CHUAL_008635 [Chamberlinius hualienensis]